MESGSEKRRNRVVPEVVQTTSVAWAVAAKTKSIERVTDPVMVIRAAISKGWDGKRYLRFRLFVSAAFGKLQYKQYRVGGHTLASAPLCDEICANAPRGRGRPRVQLGHRELSGTGKIRHGRSTLTQRRYRAAPTQVSRYGALYTGQPCSGTGCYGCVTRVGVGALGVMMTAFLNKKAGGFKLHPPTLREVC